MSLRILFADDSVTAQNMGKKILTEAGYEVIAVSNGAAAVKKIAEHKPDIIILDVYMPGYSGLEVCEKVRSNIATIKTPVLLTVGKMEPYKPEDANRVRADGVIIKPFEASDLLAIIKKFEERIKAMPAPAVMAPPPARKVDLYPEPETPEPPTRPKVTQPTVEVPDHMASSSAFSDLLGSEAGYPTPHFVVPSSPSQADETAKLSAVPDFELPMSWRPDAAPEPMILVPPHQAAAHSAVSPTATEAPAPVAVSEPEPEPTPEQLAEPEVLPPTEAVIDGPPSPVILSPAVESPEDMAAPVPAPGTVRPIQIPVYQDPSPAEAAPAEFMPTAAAPIGDIDVPREPALQESAEEITRSTVADAREAGLVPTSHTDHAPATASSVPAAPMHVAEMSVASPTERPEADLHVAPPIIESDAQESHSSEMAVEAVPLETVQSPEAATPEPHLAPPTLTNDDFEARVAAAMTAYSHAQPAQTETSASKNGLSDVPSPQYPEAGEASPVPAVPSHVASAQQPASASQSHPFQQASIQHTAAPAVAEPEPQLEETYDDVKAEHAPEAASIPNIVVPHVSSSVPADTAHAASVTTEAVAARVEAELPAAANAIAEAAEASGAEHHNIAQVVHRVMERMKGDLVDEIVRELKGKK